MKTKTPHDDIDPAIWQRVMELKQELSPDGVRGLMEIEFAEYVHGRIEELSTKAGAGTLHPSEQEELDFFENLGLVLHIFHSDASAKAAVPAPRRKKSGPRKRGSSET